MRHRPLTLLVVASLFAGCRGIPDADPTWRRQELEVQVDVDPPIAALLRQETDAEALEAVVADTVFGLADVGMRFYPVPSTSYEGDQTHPDYLLTVHVQDVGAYFATPAKQTTHEEVVDSTLDRIHCTAVATLLRRRGEGPPLIVGKSVGNGEARVQEAAANLTSMREFELRSADPYGIPPRLRSQQLRASIAEAVSEALAGLVEPIERELPR